MKQFRYEIATTLQGGTGDDKNNCIQINISNTGQGIPTGFLVSAA